MFSFIQCRKDDNNIVVEQPEVVGTADRRAINLTLDLVGVGAILDFQYFQLPTSSSAMIDDRQAAG